MIEPGRDAADAKARAKLYAKVEAEILKGLPNEQDRRAECLRNMAYYNLRGADMVPRRSAESDADYHARPKRALPFARRVVNVLCSKLYSPGPGRKIDDDQAATEWLESVYQDCLMNSLWQRADRMSTLNGMAAFQVGATGDPDKPVRVHLWSGWHEVIPYELPDRANEAACVVTIDCLDKRTRYTLWTPEWYRTYATSTLGPHQTSGGRAATPTGGGDNPYGILPFAFVWFELPVGGFDSVHGIGDFLSDISETIDGEMSDLAQAMAKYHAPIPVAYDCSVEWQPIVKMGNWIRVNRIATDLQAAPAPRLDYLQAQLDVEGGWANIRGVVDSELEAMGIPLTAYRMDSATLPSGAALVAEQKPLIDYAMERREPFRRYESDLAAVCLTVGGSYGSDAALESAASLPLTLTWPPVVMDLPGPDRDEADAASVQAGYESPIMVVMRRFGFSRQQAIAHLQQVADDHLELSEIMADARAQELADKAQELGQVQEAAAEEGGPNPSSNGKPEPVEEMA